jgi:hypothetical protein
MLATYHIGNLGPDEAESFAQVTALLRRVAPRTPFGGFIARMIARHYYDALANHADEGLREQLWRQFFVALTRLSYCVSLPAKPNSTSCARSSLRTQTCSPISLKAIVIDLTDGRPRVFTLHCAAVLRTGTRRADQYGVSDRLR